MTTPNIPAGAATLLSCGCPPSALHQGDHHDSCVIRRIIAKAEAELPVDSDVYRARFWAEDAQPELADPQVVWPLAIVMLDEWDLPGLWQRHRDGWYVPISTATFTAHIRQCLDGSCGMCESCAGYAAYADSQVRGHTDVEGAAHKALAAATDALRTFEMVVAGAIAGDELELSSIDTRDVRTDLQEAEHRLRNVLRIVSPHVAKIRPEVSR